MDWERNWRLVLRIKLKTNCLYEPYQLIHFLMQAWALSGGNSQIHIQDQDFALDNGLLLSKTEEVERLTVASYLDPRTKRHYWQSYLWRLRQLKNMRYNVDTL